MPTRFNHYGRYTPVTPYDPHGKQTILATTGKLSGGFKPFRRPFKVYIRFFVDNLGEIPMLRFLTTATLAIALGVSSQFAHADDSASKATEDYSWADFRLSDEPSSSANLELTRPSVSAVNRLRQQRAAYSYNQRLSRIEANAWIGHEPLRPSWSALPMMSSRYPARRTITVPYYIQ